MTAQTKNFCLHQQRLKNLIKNVFVQSKFWTKSIEGKVFSGNWWRREFRNRIKILFAFSSIFNVCFMAKRRKSKNHILATLRNSRYSWTNSNFYVATDLWINCVFQRILSLIVSTRDLVSLIFTLSNFSQCGEIDAVEVAIFSVMLWVNRSWNLVTFVKNFDAEFFMQSSKKKDFKLFTNIFSLAENLLVLEIIDRNFGSEKNSCD